MNRAVTGAGISKRRERGWGWDEQREWGKVKNRWTGKNVKILLQKLLENIQGATFCQNWSFKVLKMQHFMVFLLTFTKYGHDSWKIRHDAGKNQKSGMGKVRGWEKPKDGDENEDGDGDPYQRTGIPIPVTALIMTQNLIMTVLTLVQNYFEWNMTVRIWKIWIKSEVLLWNQCSDMQKKIALKHDLFTQ